MARCRLVQVLKKDPKGTLRASRDADKIGGYVLAFEKDRLPASIGKLPQIGPPSAPEIAAQARAGANRVSRGRAASGRER